MIGTVRFIMDHFQKRPKSRDRSKGKGKASKESESTLTLTQMVKKATGDENGAGDKVCAGTKKYSTVQSLYSTMFGVHRNGPCYK